MIENINEPVFGIIVAIIVVLLIAVYKIVDVKKMHDFEKGLYRNDKESK